MDFRLPSLIPQDLQLIQDLVGDLPQPPSKGLDTQREDDSILSSDEEDDARSEKEVEANIFGAVDNEEGPVESSISLDDSDDESSSESESEPEVVGQTSAKRSKEEETLGDEDDDTGAGANISPDQMRTKNEDREETVNIPEVEEVGEDEVLDKVGEIMSIIDKVVIVRGTPSQVQSRGSEKALDSDTLLVFEDRKVLGYVWETFGPTNQPFYRVQFNDAYPLDTEKVRVSRAVFHVPLRSHFVFVGLLKQLKGSDASNAHDEEPGEEELEFSDDEAEREHKRTLKDRRGGGEMSSRHTTPGPSHPRGSYVADDLYGINPYDAAYNDMDIGAGPSRPPPMPYDDDPYSDSYGLPEESVASISPQNGQAQLPSPVISSPTLHPPHERSRGRGRGQMFTRDNGRERGRGRGRGQDRRQGDRQRGRGRGRDSGELRPRRHTASIPDEYHARPRRDMSPTSAAIARATGQYSDGPNFPNPQQQNMAQPSWGYQQYSEQYNQDYAYQQPYVQPHINPRFASMFGIDVAQAFPQQLQDAYGQGSVWTDHWTVPTTPSQPSREQHDNSHDRY
ncbi:Gar1/Naf1 RNA binding region-domain-containing protein [Cytidiella melzeri]|nr:Gar1/Naf1 RNA binding region-domain-containing protein [Cytidiella melzeri]